MIRTAAAASILGVSANTLRSWERRYGFPVPRRSSGGHRRYALQEIQALRQTLAETQDISSAIALARQRGAGAASPSQLAVAFTTFDDQAADRVLEESLTIRTVERTVEELLLPAVAELADPGGATAEYELAWRYATGWLAALTRQAAPSVSSGLVVVFDASAPCDLDWLYARALELALRRAGLRTVCLTPALNRSRLGRALRALAPPAVIITGRRSSLDTIGRLIYTVRSLPAAPLVLDYRGAIPEGAGGSVGWLGDTPLTARDRLLELVHGDPTARPLSLQRRAPRRLRVA
ncbi:MAG TPA: MerR family DNA-binding transcriptional regulator [Solirubrobacteraceae bacterium]|nr:MerR family DNA-binding transcriptional regulator [Solirubrobacteraceae bacterium]